MLISSYPCFDPKPCRLSVTSLAGSLERTFAAVKTLLKWMSLFGGFQCANWSGDACKFQEFFMYMLQ